MIGARMIRKSFSCPLLKRNNEGTIDTIWKRFITSRFRSRSRSEPLTTNDRHFLPPAGLYLPSEAGDWDGLHTGAVRLAFWLATCLSCLPDGAFHRAESTVTAQERLLTVY